MKVGVIVFPGSNRERDVAWVTRELLQCPTRLVWHTETDVSDCDTLILPGGFSYGDYLRCGAIARFAPVMPAVTRHAEQGKPVLGICNGFQVLTEAHLLPGALVRNHSLKFVCTWVHLRVEQVRLPWTARYQPGEVLKVPIAHGEGRYYADPVTLAELEGNGQVLFRYVTPTGEAAPQANPNGSLNNIAGICNRAGNVLGLMPHPENASDPVLGLTDGLRLFKGMLTTLVIQ
ncbi:phosphoribosylformylglycinamidine synthase subunit PurQ [Candidatus Cyanaurora vandensis]|uniref:phosphoribosylformylglycinamidine synthase subunit PurQ n=1 Tax=Candidatus Cyanaurora vandensis TaxID=2714958 RepID=UPI00257ADB00|nr:phosphoribosylformylglycinamidine synthase subunit PurQ [Candidatus Cyanaurora vandensis]